MSRKNKRVTVAQTKEGFQCRVWITSKGAVLPTHWKQQAGELAGPVIITKRMANRRARRVKERREGLLAYRRSMKKVFVGVDMAMPGTDRSVTVHA